MSEIETPNDRIQIKLLLLCLCIKTVTFFKIINREILLLLADKLIDSLID